MRVLKGAKVDWNRLNVFVRLRPLAEAEVEAGALECTECDEQSVALADFCPDGDYLKAKRLQTKRFSYDKTFGEGAAQVEVYGAACQPLVTSALEGKHAACLCYGATGAGKTYTMLGSVETPGVMVLALQDLFDRLESGARLARKSEESGEGGSGKGPAEAHDMPEGVAGGVASFRVALSYLEVYNENIYDLLSDAPGSKQGDSPPPSLDLREGPEGVLVAGLTRFEASSAKEVMELLHQGNRRRQTEPTRCNETSSRSHAVLQVFIETEGTDGNVRCGKLSLVDLAGSERHIATERRSQRSLEGASINRSLLALSGCINALVQAQRHVPFRNSKLTQILKDSLAGRCQTSMIANITPSHLCIGETANTLHWAARAKQIRIAPEAVRSRCFEKATAINRRASTSAVGGPGRPTTRSMTTRSMMRTKTGRVSCVPAPTRSNLDRVQARVRTTRPSTAAPTRRDSVAPRKHTIRPATARARVARQPASAAGVEMRQMRERMEALESSMVEMRRITTDKEESYRSSLESVLQEKEAILKQKDELIGMLLKLGCGNGATPEKKAMLQTITNQFNAGPASPTTAADAPEVLAKASARKVVTPDPRTGQENASPMQTGGLSF